MYHTYPLQMIHLAFAMRIALPCDTLMLQRS